MLDKPPETVDRAFIPYMGPDPSPSRSFGIAAMFVIAILAAASGVRALLYLQRASIDKRLAAGRGSMAVASQLRSNASTIQNIGRFFWVGLLLAIVLDGQWRRRRRPQVELNARGEAFVESPLARSVPPQVAVFMVMLFLAGLVFTVSGFVSTSTPLRDWASHRVRSAAGGGCIALGWGLWAARIAWADRSHRRRLAASAPWRMAPAGPVPFYPPESERDAARAVAGRWPARGQTAMPHGFVALVILAMCFWVAAGAVIAIIMGIGEIRKGHARGVAGAGAGLVVLLATVAVAGRQLRRRRVPADDRT